MENKTVQRERKSTGNREQNFGNCVCHEGNPRLSGLKNKMQWRQKNEKGTRLEETKRPTKFMHREFKP